MQTLSVTMLKENTAPTVHFIQKCLYASQANDIDEPSSCAAVDVLQRDVRKLPCSVQKVRCQYLLTQQSVIAM